MVSQRFFLPQKKLKQKDLKIFVEKQNEYKENLALLESLTYSNPKINPYTELEKFANSHYYSANHYGIIKKNPDASYSLYIYQIVDRKNIKVQKIKTTLTLTKNGEIRCDKKEYLQRLILLQKEHQQTVGIDFAKSQKQKKPIVATEHNPYSHDHFIYLSFINIQENLKTPEKFKEHLPVIRKYFQQDNPFTFNLVRINHEKNLKIKLKKVAQKKRFRSKFKDGKIYLLFDAHCLESNSHLNSEYLDAKKNVANEKFTIPSLIKIMRQLHIPKDAELDIDVYACQAGASSPGKASFIEQFSEALHKEGYSNYSIKGNRHDVYGYETAFPKRIFSQSSVDTPIFGTLHEPLTSLERLQNTGPYISIQELVESKEPAAIASTRNRAIQALKERSKKLCEESEKTISFDEAHQELKAMYQSFKLFDNLAIKLATDYSCEKEFHEGSQKSLKSLAFVINREYLGASNHFNFEQSYQDLSTISKEILEDYHAKKPSLLFRPM